MTMNILRRSNSKNLRTVLRRFTFVLTPLILLVSALYFAGPILADVYKSREITKMGDVYYAKDNYSKALTSYLEANRIRETEELKNKIAQTEEAIKEENTFRSGQMALDQKDWEQAYRHFSEVTKSSTYYDQAFQLLSFALEQINNKDEQEDSALDDLDLAPTKQDKTPVKTSPTSVVESKQTTIYLASMNKSVTCKQEGSDAVKGANQAFQTAFDADKTCMDDQGTTLQKCGGQCNQTVMNDIATYCNGLPIEQAMSCSTQMQSKRETCITACKDNFQQKSDACFIDSKAKQSSLNDLLQRYCN